MRYSNHKRVGACITLIGSVVASLGLAEPAPAPRILPNQNPLELPDLNASGIEGRRILPPAPIPAEATSGALDRGLLISVRTIEIEGNRSLPADLLEKAVAPFVGRRLASEDLLDLQRALTRLYVERGYATSFVTVPDQDLAEGRLRIRVVEGQIARLALHGLSGFSHEYLRRRLAPTQGETLDVLDLEKRLQILQLDPRIESIRAHLSNDLRPGDSRLDVEIVEAKQTRGHAVLSNDRTPAVGSINGRFNVTHANAFGWGDEVSLTAVLSEGLREFAFDAGVPINRFDTLLSARFRYADSDIVEPLFSGDNIESEFLGVGLALSHPVIRTPRFRWNLRLDAEMRQSRTSFGGASFATSAGSDTGLLRIMAFRFSTQASFRDRNQVFAARTMLSVGAPIFGAAKTDGGDDDSEFTSWLGQVQWARRFDYGIELVARFDWQLAGDPLPPQERFAIGGVRTVRGYPENRIVRDNGFNGSLELRIPLTRSVDGRPLLAIAPFIDGGRVWFRERGPTPTPQNLATAGVGLRAQPLPWLSGTLYWGGRLLSVPDSGNSIQEDHRIHFSLAIDYF